MIFMGMKFGMNRHIACKRPIRAPYTSLGKFYLPFPDWVCLFFSLFTCLSASSGSDALFAWDIQLRSKIKTGESHICLSELIESIKPKEKHLARKDQISNNKETGMPISQLEDKQGTSKIMLLLEKECHIEVERELRFISKKEFKESLQRINLPDEQELNILGDRCEITSLFKKVPFQIMQSFVAKKTGGHYFIIKGKDVLIPQNMNIFFEINRLEKTFFIKAHAKNGQKITYAEFPLESEESGTYDIGSGNEVILLLNQDQIRIRFKGKALEPGRIGDVIQIRSLGLKPEQRFKARLINRYTAKILP